MERAISAWDQDKIWYKHGEGVYLRVPSDIRQKALEAMIAGAPYEVGAIFDSGDRLLVGPKRGGKYSLFWTHEELSIANRTHMTHSHPDAMPLSESELEVAATAGLISITAVHARHGRLVRTVAVAPNGWPESGDTDLIRFIASRRSQTIEEIETLLDTTDPAWRIYRRAACVTGLHQRVRNRFPVPLRESDIGAFVQQISEEFAEIGVEYHRETST
ncbi:hypothetical protein BH11ARM2_BH11ARM2_07280 [soil metagenome]